VKEAQARLAVLPDAPTAEKPSVLMVPAVPAKVMPDSATVTLSKPSPVKLRTMAPNVTRSPLKSLDSRVKLSVTGALDARSRSKLRSEPIVYSVATLPPAVVAPLKTTAWAWVAKVAAAMAARAM